MVAPIRYAPGERFGKWTVLRQGKVDTRGMAWECQCDCGSVRDVLGTRLRYGKSTSCGCTNTQAIRDTLWKGVGDIGHRMLSNYRRSAKQRGLECTITLDYMWELYTQQGGMCALTGVPLTMYEYTTAYREYANLRGGQRGQRKNGTASLDRIDSSVGYVEGNVQWVHKDINIMKSSHTVEHFIKLCQLVVTHAQV